MDPTPRCTGSGEFVTEAQIVHCAHEERTGRVAKRRVVREGGLYPARRSHHGEVRCSCFVAAGDQETELSVNVNHYVEIL